MPRLLARYLLLAAAVVLLNFALPRLLPGDPLDADLAEGLNSAAPVLTTEARQQLRAYYHLDRPLPRQFLAYLTDLGHADLGWSISQSAPVGQLIAARLPWTLGLLLGSIAISSTAGIVLGLLAAWRGGRTDRAIVLAATALAAIPEFLVAMALILLLAVGLGWFPLAGARQSFAAAPSDVAEWLAAAADVGWHLALPAATLVLAGAASFVLLARGAVLDVIRAPYVTTAQAKGLPDRQVAIRHVLPNALLPILTFLGLRVGQVLGGEIVVERVFAIPGVGLLAYDALQARDYPILQAVFLFASLFVLLINFTVDLIYRRWPLPRG